jgi:acyl homoserine lactone synthase
MKLHHFTWEDPNANPALYWEFLRLRKKMFVDGRRWPMPCFRGAEFDFYDLPFASYLFLTDDNGRLVAGLRMIRTDNVVEYNGQTLTYMIRDAWRGTLPTIPPDVVSAPPPCDAHTWELSRIVSIGGVRATGMLVRGVGEAVARLGGTRTIFLGSPQFIMLGHLLGFKVATAGPLITEKESKDSSYQALITNVVPDKRKPFPMPSMIWPRCEDYPQALTA